jgi:hypothetical protein
MIEAVKNAVRRFAEMGVLKREKIQLRRNSFEIRFSLSGPEYLLEDNLRTLFSNIAQFTVSNIHDFH